MFESSVCSDASRSRERLLSVLLHKATRHSFVSLLSDRGVLEEISRLVGHWGTAVTEEVYGKQIQPVIQTGAVVMDGIFGTQERRS